MKTCGLNFIVFFFTSDAQTSHLRIKNRINKFQLNEKRTIAPDSKKIRERRNEQNDITELKGRGALECVS